MHLAKWMALAAVAALGCHGGDSSGDERPPVDAGAEVRDASGDGDARRRPQPGDPCVTRADCDDGLFCTGVEECIAGRCTSARNAACRDPGGCAIASCDEAALGCAFDATRGSCTEGVCTSNAGCQPLDGCTGDADPRCDDARACTDDLCVSGQCVHVPVDARCPAVGACGVGVCLGDSVAHPSGCGARPDAARCAVTEGCAVDLSCAALPSACTDDHDCADGSWCDGVERCVSGRCVHGDRTTCAGRDACEHASCSTAGVGDPWCRITRLPRCP